MNQPHRQIPRVCLVAPLPPPFGGIARWTELITTHAQRMGSVAFHVIDTAPRWRATHDLRTWRRVIFGTLHGLIMLGKLLWRLSRGTDVVHLTTSGQLAIHRDIAMLRLARVFRVPVLYHLRFGRVPELARANNSEWRRLVKALELASSVIPIDRPTEQALRERMPELRLYPLPNCVDPATLPSCALHNPSEPNILLFVGWVIPSKGIEDLLTAWEKMKVLEWRLVILGSVAEAYRQELQARYCVERVVFLGARPHPETLEQMSRADILALPSHTEGFPNVVIEAMALGKAIVATRVGAIPEMLEEGRCGCLVHPQAPAALQSALSRLVHDPQARIDLGARAKQRFQEQYTLETVYNRLLSIWCQPSLLMPQQGSQTEQQ